MNNSILALLSCELAHWTSQDVHVAWNDDVPWMSGWWCGWCLRLPWWSIDMCKRSWSCHVLFNVTMNVSICILFIGFLHMWGPLKTRELEDWRKEPSHWQGCLLLTLGHMKSTCTWVFDFLLGLECLNGVLMNLMCLWCAFCHICQDIGWIFKLPHGGCIGMLTAQALVLWTSSQWAFKAFIGLSWLLLCSVPFHLIPHFEHGAFTLAQTKSLKVGKALNTLRFGRNLVKSKLQTSTIARLSSQF